MDSGLIRSGRGFLLCLAAYFVLQVAFRIGLAAPLSFDEAEQILMSQQLRLGYGTQPPLYYWLQWCLFQMFGVNLFALAALKNLLLFSLYVCIYFTAKPLVGAGGAMAASASLLLMPQFSWEAQRDLTHTVLSTAIAAATLWLYFTLVRRPAMWRHALMGLLVGLGLLSKYNFAVFLAGLATASLLVAHYRQVLWNRRMLLAAGVALLIFLPHAVWLFDHLGIATAGTLEKMREGGHADYLSNVASGLSSVLLTTLTISAPQWLVYGFFSLRFRKKRVPGMIHPEARFFALLHAAFCVYVTAIVLTGEVSAMRGRWLQPLLFSLPLAWLVLWPVLLQRGVTRRILQIAQVAGVIILLAFPVRGYLGPMIGKKVRTDPPYSDMSAQLDRLFPNASVLVVSEQRAAASLYLQQPARRTLLLDDVLKQRPHLQGQVIVLMRGAVADGWMEKLQDAYPDSRIERQGRLDLPYPCGAGKAACYDYASIRIGAL
ncbi:glycosyltransferase family 39 protein [Noviherbaspirillum massiliense]|uniref:glycosyltransferase family 39 protein n=1 Tax=Noviherbaspirillum massiliense TaxID=1465823 RepID=UPI0002D4A997|nr:glycosyltransferase family 39 protein [Noviherbaspirillum massiliense]